MSKQAVAVIYGGPSTEHEVSVRSADGVIPALLEAGFTVVPVHVLKDRRWVFGARIDSAGRFPGAAAAPDGVAISAGGAAHKLAHEIDLVFPVVHGEMGEDGSLQGFLTALGVPFIGSGVLSSAICMNKPMAKQVMASETEVFLLSSEVVDREEWRSQPSDTLQRLARLRAPLVVKPVDAGSSVGVTLVRRHSDLGEPLRVALAASPTSCAMVECFAAGPEVTCVVAELHSDTLDALPPILIRPKAGPLFDYEAKYTPGAADEICPAPLPEGILARIRNDSCSAFRALRCRGFARFDFILDENKPAFLEANTIPGLTSGSLLPKSVRAAGWTMAQFLNAVIETASARRRQAVADSAMQASG